MSKSTDLFWLVFLFSLNMCSCTRPLFVTHWSAADRAFIKKKGYGYPSHNRLSVIACFDELCLNKAEWRNRQNKHQFKGFKKKYEYHPGRHKIHYAGDTSYVKEGEESAVVSEINQIQNFENVHFAFGKAELDTSSIGEIDELLHILLEHPSLKVKIMGHTDDIGLEEFNMQLSKDRAKAVANYLIQNGVDRDRVICEGFGSSKPVISGDSESADKKNRRVEFLIYDE